MDSRSRSGPGSRPRPHQNSHALPKGTLPKKLQLFFAPHSPVPYAPPMKKKKPALPYTGVASYVCYFEESGKLEETTDGASAPAAAEKPRERKFRNPEYAAQCRVEGETKAEKRQRLRRMRVEHNAAKIKGAMIEWDPTKDDKIQGDPYKTLFVARASYQVTERDLKKVFGEYGAIRSVRIVRDVVNGKSRGYAFIEYEHTADMKEAYKHADGAKIEGRRVLVDVERGRTMEGWRPARLGGGLGAVTRKPKKPTSGRAEKPAPREHARDERAHRGAPSRDERLSTRPRDYRAGESSRRGPDPRNRRDDRERPPPSDRERDYGMTARYRERDPRERRYDDRYARERERGVRYEKRYREVVPDHAEADDRPGKKKRELEEGELDHREVRETRRRERDMM